MGGQHIAKALKTIYKEKVGPDGGYRPESVEKPYRVVITEIIMNGCPLELVKLAAGEHQKLQGESQDTNTRDMVAMMIQHIDRQVARGEGREISEKQLFVLLQQMGVAAERDVPKTEKQQKKTTEELTVCTR